MSAVPFAMLRHAPTEWNAAGRLQGLTDTCLSRDGEAAAPSEFVDRQLQRAVAHLNRRASAIWKADGDWGGSALWRLA